MTRRPDPAGRLIGALERVEADLEKLGAEERALEAAACVELLRDAVGSVSRVRAGAFRELRYPEGRKGLTLRELGELFGLSASRVHSILQADEEGQ